jgi:hypothetical protein
LSAKLPHSRGPAGGGGGWAGTGGDEVVLEGAGLAVVVDVADVGMVGAFVALVLLEALGVSSDGVLAGTLTVTHPEMRIKAATVAA